MKVHVQNLRYQVQCFCHLLFKSYIDSLQLFRQFTKCSIPFITHIQNMTLLTGQTRTENFSFSLCVQAHFEQQEFVIIHCCGVCIFVGVKFVTLLGLWRAYLSYRYDYIISGFSLFLFIPTCF